jgi:hypothetical protein
MRTRTRKRVKPLSCTLSYIMVELAGVGSAAEIKLVPVNLPRITL